MELERVHVHDEHACDVSHSNPPPTTVDAPAPVARPIALAMACVPVANPGTSNLPIGPFQKIVLQP